MENRPAQTAVGPTVIVAVEQYEEHPVLRDELARRFLPASAKIMVALTRWRPVRRWMVNAMEKKMPGMWASFLCRKRYIDDRLRDSTAAGLEAIVILGAGLDTRAYRLPAIARARVFEVDLPENIEVKRTLLQKVYGAVPGHVTLVPVDFETQDLGDTLASHGYDVTSRTFFIWEGVTMYLTEDGVRATLAFLAGTSPGSRLVFTHLPQDFLDGKAFYGSEALYQQYKIKRGLWRFGIDPDRVPEFLAEYGWRVIEQPTAEDFAARYVTPTGRDKPVSQLERSVCAERM
ncbi:class I SAM-dependent methyltransferase [Mycolicibacillus trivialis]